VVVHLAGALGPEALAVLRGRVAGVGTGREQLQHRQREACRLAGSPTSLWPSLVKATYDGKALPPPTVVPSAEGIITGLPPSMCAAAELEVPKSIPITLAILHLRAYK